MDPWMDAAHRGLTALAERGQAPIQRKGAGNQASPAPDDREPLPPSGSGHSMPDDVRTKMEESFAADFSAVRIHEGPQAKAMGALAYTQGSDIYFAPGQYQPGNQQGQELLGHELGHVVQQSQGRVRETIQARGVAVNDDDVLEREADAMGARAARGDVARTDSVAGSATQTIQRRSASSGDAVQRADDDETEGEDQRSLIEQLREALSGWDTDSAEVMRLIRSANEAERAQILADGELMQRLRSALGRTELVGALESLGGPLTERLTAAMDGWGCDSEQIRQMITRASEADKALALADGALMTRLRSELSREDAIHALTGLHAPLALRLDTAMNGWGADVAAIRTMIVAAPAADRDAALADTALTERLASEVSWSEMASILSAAGVAFEIRFALAIEPWNVGLQELCTMAEGAAPAERQAVWSDTALMNRAHAALGEQDYLDLVTALRMFQPGTPAEGGASHTSASDADSSIRAHLAAYVGDAVTAGRQIEGQVGVVGGTDWDRAGIAHYGEATWNGGKSTSINAFVDSHGRVWIHKDRGNAGTMIHEAVHKYSDRAMIGVSQPLNEGVTEYFTRVVCAALAPPIAGRGNYQSNYDCVVALVALVSEATVASAYFDGDIDGLETAFVAAKSQNDWNDFIGHTRNNRWADAAALCTP